MKDGVVVVEEGSLQQPNVLPQQFYSRETVDVAKDLLGKILVRTLRKNRVLEGRIVEVEAYRGKDDPASHAYRGLTERNKVMFGQVGTAYVYFIYGNHYCLNVTARIGSEEAGAVLIRAIEPTSGTRYMLKNRRIDERNLQRKMERGTIPPPWLTNGPGKLTQAMRITRKQNGIDLTNRMSELWLREDIEGKSEINIESTERVGINRGKDRPWRFYIKDNAFVSKP
jgi:DNA-3-methyladenine glycosylase